MQTHDGFVDLVDRVPVTVHNRVRRRLRGRGRLAGEKAVATVEFALLLPLMLLVSLGTIEAAWWVHEYGQLERLAGQIADTSDSASAATVQAGSGVTVTCWERSTAPGCFTDTWSLERTQVVLTATSDGLTGFLWPVTLEVEAVGRIAPP